MTTKTTTVYEALQEKKLLEKRIDSLNFNKAAFITYAGESDDTIDGIAMEDINKKLKSNYDSIQHLLKNHSAYTAAINQSNAVTKITINNKEYTVAEAISRYQDLDNEIKFLQAMAAQYREISDKVRNHNAVVKDPNEISKYVNNILGDSKKDQALIDTTTNTYLKNHLWKVIDPNNIGDNFEKMLNDVNAFKEQVHFILTKSNAITEITIELED
jgi:hypothetical protein